MDRPILFSGAMVRSILKGRKTQTRRTVKSQPMPGESIDWLSNIVGRPPAFAVTRPMSANLVREIPCPYGAPSDRLWVRETWRADDYAPEDVTRTIFAADFDGDHDLVRWRPSIYMPRARSRITLAVESVRVERLRDISEEDARAEGCERDTEPCDHLRRSCEEIGCLGQTCKSTFCGLWCDINGAESWTANPWVWVVGFSVAEVRHG